MSIILKFLGEFLVKIVYLATLGKTSFRNIFLLLEPTLFSMKNLKVDNNKLSWDKSEKLYGILHFICLNVNKVSRFFAILRLLFFFC